MQIRG